MRILFVNHSASVTGAPISCFHTTTKLGEGFTSVFATAEHGPIVDRLRDLGIPSYVLGEKGFLGAAYIARFLNILGGERIDLLHLNTLTSFCKYAAIAGALRRLPLVWVASQASRRDVSAGT